MILDTTFPIDPRVSNEASALIKKGHEVYLFCLSYKKNFIKEEEINYINVRRYYSSTLTYKLSALAYSFPFIEPYELIDSQFASSCALCLHTSRSLNLFL